MPFGFGRAKRKRGLRKGRGFVGWDSSSNCICPKCKFIVPYKQGIACYKTKCPRCGSLLTREFPND